MDNRMKITSIYFAITGLAAVSFGIADILVWTGFTGGVNMGILEISGDDFFRQVWGGLVVFFGGVFMLAGCRDIINLHNFSKVLLGAAMLWIVAGCDIFAMICEGIFAPENAPEFLNTFSGFIEQFMPPYAPAVILLPFTLVIVYLYYAWGFSDRN